MVLHISAYSSRRFATRARVSDDILDFSVLLIGSLDALCWIVSVMISLMMSTYCSVSNRFRNSSVMWNVIFDTTCAVASWPSVVFPSTSKSGLILLITILWSLSMLTWLMIVTSVTMSGLFVRMLSSLHRLGFSTSISSLLLEHDIHDFVLS